MAKETNGDLQRVPLITPGALARAMNVGVGTIRTAAYRAGVEIPRMPNNRDYMSFDAAIAIRHELTGNR